MSAFHPQRAPDVWRSDLATDVTAEDLRGTSRATPLAVWPSRGSTGDPTPYLAQVSMPDGIQRGSASSAAPLERRGAFSPSTTAFPSSQPPLPSSSTSSSSSPKSRSTGATGTASRSPSSSSSLVPSSGHKSDGAESGALLYRCRVPPTAATAAAAYTHVDPQPSSSLAAAAECVVATAVPLPDMVDRQRERIVALVRERDAATAELRQLHALFQQLHSDYDDAAHEADRNRLELDSLRAKHNATEEELRLAHVTSDGQQQRIDSFAAEWARHSETLREELDVVVRERDALREQRDSCFAENGDLRQQLIRLQGELHSEELKHHAALRDQEEQHAQQLRVTMQEREELIQSKAAAMQREAQQVQREWARLGAGQSSVHEDRESMRWRLCELETIVTKKDQLRAELEQMVGVLRTRLNAQEEVARHDAQRYTQRAQELEQLYRGQLSQEQHRLRTLQEELADARKATQEALRQHEALQETHNEGMRELAARSSKLEEELRRQLHSLRNELDEAQSGAHRHESSAHRSQREAEALRASTATQQEALHNLQQEHTAQTLRLTRAEGESQILRTRLREKEREAELLRCAMEQVSWTQEMREAAQHTLASLMGVPRVSLREGGRLGQGRARHSKFERADAESSALQLEWETEGEMALHNAAAVTPAARRGRASAAVEEQPPSPPPPPPEEKEEEEEEEEEREDDDPEVKSPFRARRTAPPSTPTDTTRRVESGMVRGGVTSSLPKASRMLSHAMAMERRAETIERTASRGVEEKDGASPKATDHIRSAQTSGAPRGPARTTPTAAHPGATPPLHPGRVAAAATVPSGAAEGGIQGPITDLFRSPHEVHSSSSLSLFTSPLRALSFTSTHSAASGVAKRGRASHSLWTAPLGHAYNTARQEGKEEAKQADREEWLQAAASRRDTVALSTSHHASRQGHTYNAKPGIAASAPRSGIAGEPEIFFDREPVGINAMVETVAPSGVSSTRGEPYTAPTAAPPTPNLYTPSPHLRGEAAPITATSAGVSSFASRRVGYDDASDNQSTPGARASMLLAQLSHTPSVVPLPPDARPPPPPPPLPPRAAAVRAPTASSRSPALPTEQPLIYDGNDGDALQHYLHDIVEQVLAEQQQQQQQQHDGIPPPLALRMRSAQPLQQAPSGGSQEHLGVADAVEEKRRQVGAVAQRHSRRTAPSEDVEEEEEDFGSASRPRSTLSMPTGQPVQQQLPGHRRGASQQHFMESSVVQNSEGCGTVAASHDRRSSSSSQAHLTERGVTHTLEQLARRQQQLLLSLAQTPPPSNSFLLDNPQGTSAPLPRPAHALDLANSTTDPYLSAAMRGSIGGFTATTTPLASLAPLLRSGPSVERQESHGGGCAPLAAANSTRHEENTPSGGGDPTDSGAPEELPMTVKGAAVERTVMRVGEDSGADSVVDPRQRSYTTTEASTLFRYSASKRALGVSVLDRSSDGSHAALPVTGGGSRSAPAHRTGREKRITPAPRSTAAAEPPPPSALHNGQTGNAPSVLATMSDVSSLTQLERCFASSY